MSGCCSVLKGVLVVMAGALAFSLPAKQVMVDKSGAGGAYTTIQAAIDADATEAGDEIIVAAGVYDFGEATGKDGGKSRVVVTKSLTIRGSGRDTCFIDGGNAVRCVAIEADDVELIGFTLRNGKTTSTSASSPAGLGGGVYSHDAANGFVVDCTLRSCSAASGGALARKTASATLEGEGLSAVRCLLTDNSAFKTSQTWCDYGASLYSCIVTRCNSTGCSPFVNVPKVVNCTVANMMCNHYFHGCGTIANCFCAQYSYRGGSGAEEFKHVYFTSVASSVITCKSQEGCTTDGEEKQLVSPLEDDCRPIVGAAILTAGSVEHLALIPEKYRALDFAHDSVPASGTIAVGAYQTAVAPASDMVVIKPISTKTRGSLVLNGKTNNWAGISKDLYFHAAAWPKFYRFQPIWDKSGFGATDPGVEYGFAAVGADTTDRFPLRDGSYLILPPQAGKGTLTLTGRNAQQAFYADPDADAATADGTADHPYATLQDAVDHVTAAGWAIVYARKGVYDRGGSKIVGGITNRVAIQGRHVRLVGLDGAENTFIVGAPDPEAGEGDYGCGSNAVRCVCASASSAVQGFTLMDGHAGAADEDKEANYAGAVLGGKCVQVLDCVITNCFAARAAVSRGVSDEHNVFLRSKVLGCRSTRNAGYCAYTDFASCLLAKNWAGSINASVLGSHCGECVYDTTVYAEGENNDFSGWGAQGDTTGPHRNSIFMGLGAYRNITVYGIVIDQLIRNTSKGTYVVSLNGTHTEGKVTTGRGFAKFCDAQQGDFRLLDDSPAAKFARYDATESPDIYRLATESLDGVIPDFTKDNGYFPAGAYRRFVRVVRGTGLNLTPAADFVDPVPGSTVTFTVSKIERPFLGFSVDGVAQPFDGSKSFDYVVPEEQEGTVTVAPNYGTDWYVDAVNGRDDGYGTAAYPLRRLSDALTYQQSGDTVHAAPGRYNEGTMVHTSALVSKTAFSASRAVVQNGVTLVGDEGAAVTFIEGEDDVENPVRCAVVYATGVLRGFTLTGGRTSRSDGSIDDGSTGAGVLGQDGTLVEDCVITNCAALVSGGFYKGIYRRCRIVDCGVLSGGNSAAGRGAYLYNCQVAGCKGTWTFDGMLGLQSTTLGPGNLSAASVPLNNNRFNPKIPVCNCLFLDNGTVTHSAPGVYSNCVFVSGFSLGENYTTDEACLFKSLAEIGVDENGVPTPGAGVAVDGGNRTIYDAANLGEKDVLGNPRFVNGCRLDVGCYEADWKDLYSKKLGRLVTVSAADPSVDIAEDGVAVPAGATLSVTVAKDGLAGTDCSFAATVANGSLAVAKDGAPWRTLTSASDVRQKFTADADSTAFDFAMGEVGSAVLGKFRREIGMLLLVR